MNKLDYKEIGKRISQERIKKGITQDELLEEVPVSLTHLSNVENGHRGVSLDVLVSVANALDCSVDYLLGTNLEKSNCKADGIITELLEDCTKEERNILMDMMVSLKKSLDENKIN